MNEAGWKWLEAYVDYEIRRRAEIERACERLRRFNADMLDLAHILIFGLATFIVALAVPLVFFLALGKWG